MRIENLEVQSCCYFVSLRTGTKIFGFISLLGCFLASVLSIWEMVVVAKVDKYVDTMLTLDVIIQAVQIVTSVFLLLGAYQEKAKFIPPWLVSTAINIVLEIFFMPALIGRFIGIDIHPSVSFTEWIIFTIFMLVDDIYGLVVVFSYYRFLAPRGSDNVM